jgi:hypothetical protein
VLLALATAALLAALVAAAARRHRRAQPITVRADEIVAASAVRELAAQAQAGPAPRWTRDAVDAPELPAPAPATREPLG